MTCSELQEKLMSRFSQDIIQMKDSGNCQLGCTIHRTAVVKVVEYLFQQLGGRLITAVGTDKSPVNGHFEIAYLFNFDQDGIVLSLKVEVPVEDPTIDSITAVLPGANWAERELQDMLGIVPQNHPDPRRLLLADDWPEDLHPLRKDFPYNFRPPRVETARPVMQMPKGSATVVTVGPFFPTLEEPAYFRLFVEGEKITGCDYRGFYSHRGIEKLADTVLDYNQIPFMSERICGICGFVHSCCYCQAVEQAGEIEVPQRARYIRTIMLELERLHSHLMWLGLAGHIIGFDTVLMQSWRIREPVMWLCEQITGNRKTYGMNLVGGVRRDITPEMEPQILETLASIEQQAQAVADALLKDTSLLLRLKGVGVLSHEDARKICVVGPTARASGIAMDSRVNRPYAGYGGLEMTVPVWQDGDVLARLRVRVAEVFTSINLIRQALSKMTPGPIMAEVPNIPPWREGIAIAEAPRGECCHYVLTGPNNRPYRWSVRAATYPQLQSVPAMLETATVADFPIIIGSIDPCFSCTERVETIDLQKKTFKIYSHEEILAQTKAKYRGGV